MKNEEPIKLSNSEKDNKILEFQRYWISYIKSHIELLWIIKENEIHIRFNVCNKHESYRLKDSLYRYVETSINSLYYLNCEKMKKNT